MIQTTPCRRTQENLDDDDPDITKEKVRQFLEEHVGSEENDDDKESDGNWKNWDDGE